MGREDEKKLSHPNVCASSHKAERGPYAAVTHCISDFYNFESNEKFYTVYLKTVKISDSSKKCNYFTSGIFTLDV